MNRDFKVIEHKFDNDIIIIPVGDVHLGAIEHNKQAWESFFKGTKAK